MTDISISVLIIEDSEDDTLLLVRQLRKNGFNPVYKQVWAAEVLRESLKASEWDLIICDFHMPKFNGIDALKIVQSMNLDTPFIVVSGVVGEEKAVEMMLAGANDYVMKSNMSRLIPAIRRELAEAQSRREKKQAEEELERYRNHLEDLVHERTRELQTVQSELLRKERMALLGQLVATVSHEICNPLGVIRNAAFLLNRKLGDSGDSDCKEYIKIIEREVDAANRIIANLSETTRTKSPNRQETNLDTLVDEIIRGVDIPQDVTFHYQRNPRPYIINADRMQLKQVLNNLISNALYAAGEKGYVFLFASSSGDNDFLRIVDTGSGIPENARESIFEPLFTTKSKGTGLGLWISKEIVYRHKGNIRVINHSDLPQKELQTISEVINGGKSAVDMSLNPNIGACFELCIPHR